MVSVCFRGAPISTSVVQRSAERQLGSIEIQKVFIDFSELALDIDVTTKCGECLGYSILGMVIPYWGYPISGTFNPPKLAS